MKFRIMLPLLIVIVQGLMISVNCSTAQDQRGAQTLQTSTADSYPPVPFMGVVPESVTGNLKSRLDFPTPPGVLVLRTDEKGPAFQAGLRDGDIIRSLDGHAVADAVGLSSGISTHAPGDTVTLDVWRSGQAVPIKVVLGDAGTSCHQGDAWACGSLGVVFANGMGVPKDETRAAALFQAACDGGYPEDCYNLGVLVHSGAGVKKDEERAIALFQSSCDADFATGCFNLGVMYLNGDGVKKDKDRAQAMFQKACDAGEALGCAALKKLQH